MQIVEPGISQVSKDYAIKISAPVRHCRNLPTMRAALRYWSARRSPIRRYLKSLVQHFADLGAFIHTGIALFCDGLVVIALTFLVSGVVRVVRIASPPTKIP